jgi:glycosyltransferase involved in cell wall biosynthesis
MPKIKVLHIYNDFNEHNGLIGTFIILSKTAAHELFDLNVCVFSHDDNESSREFQSFGGKLFSLGEPYGANNTPRSFLRLYRFIKRHRPDIVHTHCIKSNILAVFAAALARVPVICGEELTLTDLRGAGVTHLKRTLLQRPLAKTAMRICDRFIFNSQAVREDWVGEQPDPKFVVLHSPFDVDKYLDAINAGSERNPRAGPTIGFIGRLTEPKGLQILLDAMALIRDRVPAVQLVCVGEGPMEASLKASAEELHLERNVHFVGFQSNVFECLKEMDVLALPSRTEGFGKAALEAMAMGVPVIATAVGGLRELVVDGETGTLVPYGDPGKLAEAIVDLLTDNQRRLEMGRKGQERAFTMFHPARYTRALEDLYLQLYSDKVRSWRGRARHADTAARTG